MKKFLLVACAMCSMGASAQHLEWSAAQLPQTTEEGAAQGFTVYYDYLFTPANYTLCEGEGFKAYFELPTLLGKGNGGYSGKGYGMKPLMGMNNSSRDGIEPAFFAFGLTSDNQYVRTNNAGEPYGTYTDAIISIEVAADTDGGQYGMVTLTYNRGGNLSAMYVVDATAKNGEGMMVLQSRTRCPDENIQSHVAKFGVEPGHKYYVLASEKQSVELYGIAIDAVTSTQYAQQITPDAFPVNWSAAQLPQSVEEGAAQGFTAYYDYLFTPANYTLCEGEGFKAYFELPTLLGKGNGGYSGKDYGMKPLMGMNNSSRDGIEPAFFAFGLTSDNQYVRTNNAGEPYGTYTDAIISIEVAADTDGGQYGKVALNYNRGGNLSAMYVVDATAKNGEGMMVLQSRTRCPDDNIKTHTAQFGVEPGHKYYVLASEKQSVELYGIGFTPVTATNYYSETPTGIANVTANKVQGDNKMYNLAGQRITEPAKGQIYIMNGKKYIAK